VVAVVDVRVGVDGVAKKGNCRRAAQMQGPTSKSWRKVGEGGQERDEEHSKNKKKVYESILNT
jgi:hypothetical protein